MGIVLHEQKNDISEPIRYLDQRLSLLGFTEDFVHVGPLIRWEGHYSNLTLQERIRILRQMMVFVSQIDFTCKAIVVQKKHLKNETDLYQKLARNLSEFISDHLKYFYSFDKIIIYYDNGQREIMKIIVSVFSTLFQNVEFRKAKQKDYKLLQVADLVCSAKLAELKMNAKTLSRAERRVLGSDRDIKKYFLRYLNRKEFKG